MIPSNIVKFVNQGYTRAGTSILATAGIPGDVYDFYYLRALILLFEGTFTSKLWLFKAKTNDTLTSCALWPKSEIPYEGLYHHSALREVCSPLVIGLNLDPNIARDWKVAKQERKDEYGKKYYKDHKDEKIKKNKEWSKSESGKASKARYMESDIGKARSKRTIAVAKAKYGKDESAPDIICEGCPKGYKTKNRDLMKKHRGRCLAKRS